MEAHHYFLRTGGGMYIVKLLQAAQAAEGVGGGGVGWGGGPGGGLRFCQSMWTHVRTARYAPGSHNGNKKRP